VGHPGPRDEQPIQTKEATQHLGVINTPSGAKVRVALSEPIVRLKSRILRQTKTNVVFREVRAGGGRQSNQEGAGLGVGTEVGP